MPPRSRSNLRQPLHLATAKPEDKHLSQAHGLDYPPLRTKRRFDQELYCDGSHSGRALLPRPCPSCRAPPVFVHNVPSTLPALGIPMSESSLNIVLKSDNDQLALLLKGLNGTVTSAFLHGLAATFAGDQGHPQPAVFTDLNVQQVKVGKGLYGLHIQGDEAEAFMDWLGGLPGLAFWALATSET